MFTLHTYRLELIIIAEYLDLVDIRTHTLAETFHPANRKDGLTRFEATAIRHVQLGNREPPLVLEKSVKEMRIRGISGKVDWLVLVQR